MTTTGFSPVTSRVVSTVYQISGRPKSGCNTLGRVERMRVPCPAARITGVIFIRINSYFLMKDEGGRMKEDEESHLSEAEGRKGASDGAEDRPCGAPLPSFFEYEVWNSTNTADFRTSRSGWGARI